MDNLDKIFLKELGIILLSGIMGLVIAFPLGYLLFEILFPDFWILAIPLGIIAFCVPYFLLMKTFNI